MKLAFTLLAFVLGSRAFSAEPIEKPPAPPGFQWKTYDEVRCEIRVPDGWYEMKRTVGLTQVLQLSPRELGPGQSLDVGLTVNTVKCQTRDEWNEALKASSKSMSDLRAAVDQPIESLIDDKPDRLLMVVEGERFLTRPPQPRKKYHVRTVLRAVQEHTTIYFYSFTAPADEWDEAWKKTGNVMLNPLWFKSAK